MIVLATAVIGALWGAFLAKRRNGTGLDMAQHAASMGIAFALVGLIVTIVIHRSLV